MGGEKWPGHDTEPRCGLPRLPMSLVAPFCRCGSVRYDGVNAIGQRTRSAASGLTVSLADMRDNVAGQASIAASKDGSHPMKQRGGCMHSAMCQILIN
jgi:hypothetical protein